MYYFAYGSNMLRKRIEDRVGTVADLGMGVLGKYKIKFNKQGKDGSGKTNIVPDSDSRVLGVVYELSEEQLGILDGKEVGYKREPLPIEINGKFADIEVYIALANTINDNLLPTMEYLTHLINGAKEHGFPSEYVRFLEEVESMG
ncbi:MAG: gamma-glutamylcyclotransferase family protein [Minisyncoccota bacterium]